MATIQSPGIGSGLDINSLVEKLVAAERAPGDAQLTRRESKATLQISALASLKGALSSFQETLDPLKDTDGFTPHAATSSDEDILTASALTGAATGSYQVEVLALAQSQQLASAPLASSSTVVGTGTLTISLGGKSFDVEIDSSSSTLGGIRNAINKATDNTGVQATIINEVNGSRLLLSSSKTGATQTITVTQSGGNGGLNSLVYNPGTLTNLTQLQAGQDAHLRVGGLTGYDHYSPTNAVSGLVDGVTLNLKSTTAANTPITVNIANDTSAITDRVKAFIDGYNALASKMADLRSYDATTKVAGPLLGDSLLQGIESQLRSDLTNSVTGLSGSNMLSSIGITRQLDGTLELDESKLSEALDTDLNSVAAIFGSEDGIAARLSDHIDARLASDAGLEARNTSLQKEIRDIQDDKDALDARMLVIEDRYRKQFTAMDTLLASLTSTSNYLAQQLANLPTPGKS